MIAACVLATPNLAFGFRLTYQIQALSVQVSPPTEMRLRGGF